jgi:cytochrome P450
MEAGATVEADFTAPLFVSDPFPAYEAMRAAGPVVYDRRGGAWVALGYREVADLLRRPGFVPVDLRRDVASIAARSRTPMPALDRVLSANLPIDPSPRHPARHRQLARAIDPKSVAALEPGIRAWFDACCARALRDGGLDLCADIADRLPYVVIARLLGLPDEDAPFLMRSVAGFLVVLDIACPVSSYRGWEAPSRDLLAYLADHIADRRANPRADGLTRILALWDEDGVPDEEAAERCAFILLSGVETTASFLGLGLRLLVETPEALDRVRPPETPVGGLVEELLRLVSPIQRTIRVASAPLELGGRTIAEGEKIVALIGAANRDPSVFADPAAIDPERSGPAHLAFATGAHTCIGAALARLEGRAAVDGFRALPPASATGAPVEWWPPRISRRMRSYPVVLGHG